jgi:4-amino-4-deoxy-L-arabinose transferase-like glycosyltransferase
MLLAALVAVTQLPSFRRETIDWDEQTFMLMAQDLLRGHLPYIELFDNKPPGTYFSLALVMKLFGQSLEAVRWFGKACIFVAAALVFDAARPRAGRALAALAAAAFVAAHCTEFGLHTSSEIIANVPLAAALWLLLRRPLAPWSPWLAGLLLALAVLTRSNLVLVAAGVGLLYLVALVRPAAMGLPRLGLVGFVLGGLAPVLLLVAVYAAAGGLGDLLVATIAVPASYAAGQQGVAATAAQIIRHVLAPVSVFEGGFELVLGLAAVLAVVANRRRLWFDREGWLLLTVLVAVLLSMVAGGIFYTHYMLQLYVPLALLLAFALPPRSWEGRVLAVAAGLFGLLALAGALPAALASLAAGPPERPLREVAQAIAADRKPGDAVWALSGQLVLFYLDQPPLSRAGTQPDNLFRPEIMGPLQQAGYVGPDEFGRLLALRPRYVVVADDPSVDHVPQAEAGRLRTMTAGYDDWLERGHVRVLRRRDP